MRSALRNPELTPNKGPKQLSKLFFQNETQFGTQDSPNMNMQLKTQILRKKSTTMVAAIYKNFKNEGPTAKTNHTTTILTKNPTI